MDATASLEAIEKQLNKTHSYSEAVKKSNREEHHDLLMPSVSTAGPSVLPI